MNGRVKAEVAAELIYDAYQENIYPDIVTDRELRPFTGLTQGQYQNGKKYLRKEFVVANNVSYCADNKGWYLTTDPDDKNLAMKQKAEELKHRIANANRATNLPLEQVDPVRTRQFERDINRVITELDDIVLQASQ